MWKRERACESESERERAKGGQKDRQRERDIVQVGGGQKFGSRLCEREIDKTVCEWI